MLGAEQFLDAIDGDLLDAIDYLAAAVIALARQAFSVLVRERRAHRFEHGRRDEVLAGDELQTVVLAANLFVDQSRDVGVALTERRTRRAQAVVLPIGHR
jgi:hypothetical protein